MSNSTALLPQDLEKIMRLRERYASEGQELGSHLDGLLHTEFTNYWDYIRLDTLLSLQTPRTAWPDEVAFITYHQVSELYFKLCLLELEQIATDEQLSGSMLRRRLDRVTGYLRTLTDSFAVISTGMDPEQFRRFRLALVPASGFQSVQYRMIEIAATDLVNLAPHDRRPEWTETDTGISPVKAADIPRLLAELYWQEPDTPDANAPKPLALRQFNKKYAASLQAFAETRTTRNVWRCFLELSPAEQAGPELRQSLKDFDEQANLHWPLAHFKTALMYLGQGPSGVTATGGTDWRRYLPPHFQRRQFFPGLWSKQERTDWGRNWVMTNTPGAGVT